MIYVPSPEEQVPGQAAGLHHDYDQVATHSDLDRPQSSLSSESDLADSPAGQTIRSSYKSPIFDQHHPLEPCPVNGCPLNPQSGVI